MLTPCKGQEFPTKGSRKKILFDCSCGRRSVQITWKNYFCGHTKSCGKCNILDAEYFASTKFGKLRMDVPKSFSKSSSQKIDWICDCGRKTTVSTKMVTSGNTKSCGKCNVLDAEYFASTKFGKLRMTTPIETLGGSNKKVYWTCDCGKSCVSSVRNVTKGNTKSCGKCNILDAEYFASTKFGKLRMEFPSGFHPKSERKTNWVCDCGNKLKTKICYVISGQTTSCGKCNLVKACDWENKKFGRLTLLNPVDLFPQSHHKVTWKCECGGKTEALVHNVTRGMITSCGNCYEKSVNWYETNKELILSLKIPIEIDEVPSGNMVVNEIITATNTPFSAFCGVCKKDYKPRWGNVRLGRSLTCGCSTNQISHAQVRIFEFIKNLGVDAILEFSIDKFKYDIVVPSKNLVIEYNGLKWHCGIDSRRRDFKKYEIAIENGYDFISIFEDEWLSGEDKVKNLIKNRLCVIKPKSIRPKQCEILKIKSKEADLFYGQNHYIGPTKSKFNYGVFFENQMIASVSFKKPTRQTSKHSWELTRMASDPRFRIHGIWGKILKIFIEESKPKTIVSFSDNRLFQGGVYEKLGFKFDGEVRPDYYWAKNQKRFHKSGLRKKGFEKLGGKTETQLREEQGYSKIWDLGKKRWVYTTAYFLEIS